MGSSLEEEDDVEAGAIFTLGGDHIEPAPTGDVSFLIEQADSLLNPVLTGDREYLDLENGDFCLCSAFFFITFCRS